MELEKLVSDRPEFIEVTHETDSTVYNLFPTLICPYPYSPWICGMPIKRLL